MQEQQEGQEKQKSVWKSVKASDMPVVSGVVEARQRWEGQQVWCFTPWQQWRRGKVQRVFNDGMIAVRVYQRGTSGFAVTVPIEHANELLRLVEQ